MAIQLRAIRLVDSASEEEWEKERRERKMFAIVERMKSRKEVDTVAPGYRSCRLLGLERSER